MVRPSRLLTISESKAKSGRLPAYVLPHLVNRLLRDGEFQAAFALRHALRQEAQHRSLPRSEQAAQQDQIVSRTDFLENVARSRRTIFQSAVDLGTETSTFWRVQAPAPVQIYKYSIATGFEVPTQGSMWAMPFAQPELQPRFLEEIFKLIGVARDTVHYAANSVVCSWLF